jgi:hypothetical protein
MSNPDPERVAARRTPPPAFAQTALLHYEEPAEFEALRNAYLDEHQPESPTEHYFINEMANAQWRLRRIRLIESDLIRIRLSTDPTIDDQAAQAEAVRLAADKTKALQFILRHEAALRRQYERALKMFWECRRVQEKRIERTEKAENQKVQKRSQLSPALVAFERRLNEFCSAPPPLPPTEPRPGLAPVSLRGHGEPVPDLPVQP